MTQHELAQAVPAEASEPASPGPQTLRERMVTQLVEESVLDDPTIGVAFWLVPREVFAPSGTPVEQVAAAVSNTHQPERKP